MRRASMGVLVLLLLSGALLPQVAADQAPEERLASFRGAVPPAGAHLAGARILEAFPFAGVALVSGTPAALDRLSVHPAITRLYRVETLTLHLDRARGAVDADFGNIPGAPTGRNVTVAIVDSGVDGRHPAFDGRVVASVRVGRGGVIGTSSGDDDGHGTHIAGIVAGNGAMSRDQRYRGLAPEARLVAVDISESFTTTTAIRAFQWIHEHRADSNIRVVSNSWGREREDARYDPDDPVIRASDALVADGLVVVFSAGNRGRDGRATLTPEAMNPHVLAVGAASAQGRPEAYSSRGPAIDANDESLPWVKPDIVAPGTGIVSTRTSLKAPNTPRDEEERHYTVMNGTSMAAPQVAGAAALLLDARPDLSPAQVQLILQGTARDVAARGPDADTGYGLLDVRAALASLSRLGAQDDRVVVETRIPIKAQGSVAAAAGQVIVIGKQAQLPPAQAATVPVALPAGAVSVDLAFSWSGQGDLTARLEGPGSASLAFREDGPGKLRLNADVTAGAWRLVVSPDGVVADAPWTLDGHVLVRETREVNKPTELTARAGYGSPEGGFFLPQSGGGRVLATYGLLGLALLGSVSGLVAGAIVARRRR